MEEYKIPVDVNMEENHEDKQLANVGFWSKFKSFMFQEIKVELTPGQQAFEDKMNAVLNKPVTFKSFKDFWLQEVKF